MKPISFACHAHLPMKPANIARQILDLKKWPEFHGYGPLPGIKAAEFDLQTPDVVGTRIKVTNLDGSNHIEEIVEWQPDRRVQLHMKDFSVPVSRLATGFVETWDFQLQDNGTDVTRSFELHPKSILTKPFLWFISFFLKRAVARHLSEMNSAAKADDIALND